MSVCFCVVCCFDSAAAAWLVCMGMPQMRKCRVRVNVLEHIFLRTMGTFFSFSSQIFCSRIATRAKHVRLALILLFLFFNVEVREIY